MATTKRGPRTVEHGGKVSTRYTLGHTWADTESIAKLRARLGEDGEGLTDRQVLQTFAQAGISAAQYGWDDGSLAAYARGMAQALRKARGED